MNSARGQNETFGTLFISRALSAVRVGERVRESERVQTNATHSAAVCIRDMKTEGLLAHSSLDGSEIEISPML